MGDKDRRNFGFFDDALKIAQQFFPAGGIQGGERFVEKQELRFERQGARQARALGFAAG